ncbi:MAG: peptidylprolyl isomerase [Mollicutes bacterium]|nr:peptidylprolyl isomerase [Mollicutes bacterium]
MNKKIILLLFIINLLLLSACTSTSGVDKITMPKENPIVTMEFEKYGTITIELYPEKAFNTVANFVNLIEDKFYDDNTVHRVQKGFVIQGGDPTGKGNGGPGYSIKGEFSENGHDNDLKHTKGVISMARTNDPDSAGSQFFIVTNDDAKYSLDNKYAGFGKVIEGMDVIEKIEKEKFKYTNEQMGMLKSPFKIIKATVDTKGYEYKVRKIEQN